ncbi:dihydropteroate synthase [Nicoliella spurrieriana]|uniref:Dihydropteroate synthase n=1 Tax=Nicoliella spurrieriana TaxID=2925830 RepID=A0A976RSD0_9LACO|nr:dihydropteroate synthase [Nicoliella spurrieriana]UQS86736.1 dihydropteroate synthase [Nicoliella spurrieriana]
MQVKEVPMHNQNDLINIVITGNQDVASLSKVLTELHVNYWLTNELNLVIDKVQLHQLIKLTATAAWGAGLSAGLMQIYHRHQIMLRGANFELDLTIDPAIMAILNTSPDSFFDGNASNLNERSILKKVESFMVNNAKIIDLGGQSTRPGYQEIAPEVEIKRTVPFIKLIKREFPDAIISVDSYKPAVIQAVLDAGADIINDINGFEDSDAKLKLIAAYHPALIAMYNHRISQWQPDQLPAFFANRKELFASLGIHDDNWVIDPGVGFLAPDSQASDVDLINTLRELSEMNIATLIAISRKSMFKKQFGIDAKQNVWSTLVAELMMVHMGGQIIRVHDVEETNLMLQMRKQLEFPWWQQ